MQSKPLKSSERCPMPIPDVGISNNEAYNSYERIKVNACSVIKYETDGSHF